MGYAKIISWHSVEIITRGNSGITRCGKSIPAPVHTVDAIPLDEKSCETCLRLTVHEQDTSAPEE